MKILVLNSGSSSIKFQLIEMPSEKLLCNGLLERIGEQDAIINYHSNSADEKRTEPIESYNEGLQKMMDLLLDTQKGVIQSLDEIEAVGHRVVHGGNSFSDTVLLTDEVKKEIEKYCALAPLHNPNNLEGILVAEKLIPKAKQVAVFDTAFHQTVPKHAKTYAIPKELTEKEEIQLYGFHGISHKYVSEKARAYLGEKSDKIITIHLGNGCSMTAIQNGISIDHSLGFGPANGLIMGTRSGDIDHTIIFHLVNELGYELEEVNTLLTKKSGMLGLTGFSDLREISERAEKGDADCLLALKMNAYRIKKYIGSYTAAMNGLDAIVFTAGIGENSVIIRELVCEELEYLGIHLDKKANSKRVDELREINTENAKVKALVIPTNEEIEIAKQSFLMMNVER
ncbi:acetate kinase [Brumimicrobium salinarum]|uniref:Acetate kinase n=1 Tax=Brumimicrobium salinarum TaxID=2058658 RepID=A0A2I0R6K1_9FLAO|nr:acetate kinase [Brumimicrobium salinarum]PKR82213.1 acetate kinase [Brumimicrobium salinarum]